MCLDIHIQWDMCGYKYIIEYCLALKNKQVLLFETTWMNLEDTMLSELNQTQTNAVGS